MPTSARKSSISAARRGPQKAHIPYRGDNPGVGKKTGIAVKHVERKSDGFEPFEEVMQQADKRTPPKVKGRKKKQPAPEPEDDPDEDGEMSMVLDNNTPRQYFSEQTATPPNLRRAGSSSRPVATTSEFDFDAVPSPRPNLSRRSSFGPGPSSLATSIYAPDLDSDSDPGGNDFEPGGTNGDFDDYGQPEGASQVIPSPHRTTFADIDQEEEEEEGVDQHEEEEEVQPEVVVQKNSRVTGRGKDKGKQKQVREEPEEESPIEDEIATGLEDVAQSEEEEEQPEPRSKKAKIAEEAKKARGRPPNQTQSKGKKENRPVRQGVRRSAREPYKPLEWWRGEKLVYGKSASSGPVLVPNIKEIRRIPKEPPVPLGKRKRGTTRGRSKSKPVEIVLNPEEGWDADTNPQCVVLDYPGKEEVVRRIAFTSSMVNPKPAANNDWLFQKVFGDGDFIAAGQLIIPPRSRKPSKGTKDNTYIFYVIEGAINLKVYETSLVIATGGMFMVPRGNTYFIENIAERDAKLFFTQARKIALGEDEVAAQIQSAGAGSLPRSVPPVDQPTQTTQRSSSEGPAQTPPAPVNGRATSKTATKRAASTRA